MWLIATVLMVFTSIPAQACDDSDYGCKRIERNFHRDSVRCEPARARVQSELPPQGIRRITGRTYYVGLIALPYRYTVETRGQLVTIRLRIHFRNASADQLKKLRRLVAEAEGFWTQHRGREDLRFKFSVVPSAREADFSVRVLDRDVRGPYHLRWSSEWSSTTVAHEIGHMLGLDDEYPQLTVTVDHEKFASNVGRWCDPTSLMCRSSSGIPTPEHSYLVLRRAFCPERR